MFRDWIAKSGSLPMQIAIASIRLTDLITVPTVMTRIGSSTRSATSIPWQCELCLICRHAGRSTTWDLEGSMIHLDENQSASIDKFLERLENDPEWPAKIQMH